MDDDDDDDDGGWEREKLMHFGYNTDSEDTCTHARFIKEKKTIHIFVLQIA